ncbi:hypothetical protein PAMA_011330 [Pampus argenteus]
METREDTFLKAEEFFRRNAFILIEEMMELNNEPSDYTTALVDEILHSIFFLGKINIPPYSPKDIVNDDEMYNALEDFFPEPFQRYSSQLPKRSPFSCVLDMIVHQEGQQNEDMIITRLKYLVGQLKEGNADKLVSSTICVSQNTNVQNSVRYYGVSMSTSGRNPGQIMVAAGINSWDKYVADAVMTYYPKGVKIPYFDGNIKIPESIRCQAFCLSRGTPKPPCRSCREMFGLTTSEVKKWAPGNCAETESLSNLLKQEKDVRMQVQTASETCTDMNREKAEEHVMGHLRLVLRMLQFKWDNNFYTPQTSSTEE